MSDSLSDSLNAILKDPSAMAEVRSMMEGLGGAPSSKEEDPILENMAKIQAIYQRMNQTGDPRMELMNAIRPYMSPRRLDGLNQAMKLVRMTRLASIFRDMNFFM